MKTKIVALLIMTLVSAGLQSQTAVDSILQSREELYFQYLDLRNNTAVWKEADYRKLSEILEKIVLKDNRLLDTAESKIKQYDSLKKSSEALLNEKASLMRDRDDYRKASLLLLVAGGGCVLLFILFLVMYLRKSTAFSKLRKGLAVAGNSAQESLEQYKAKVAELEFRLNELTNQYDKLRKEKESDEIRLRERDLQITSLRNEMLRNASVNDKLTKTERELLAAKNEITELKKQLQEKENQKLQMEAEISSEKETLEKQLLSVMSENEHLKNSLEQLRWSANTGNEEISRQQSEIQRLISEISEKEKIIENLKNQPVHQEDYYRKLDELDLKILKLEKLEELKNKGIITGEEYSGLKQKLLAEF